MAAPTHSSSLPKKLRQLRTREVRHLAWAVGSAPLMNQHKQCPFSILDENWFEKQLEQRWAWILELDASPEPLVEAMATAPQLLGKRFECLLHFFFDHHPDFELIRAGWPIRSEATGQTIGEFDFILKGLRTGQIWHLEVACKFYLASENVTQWKAFKGPNAQDTLALKMDKLVQQLSRSDEPDVAHQLQRHRIRIDERVLLMKGAIFHHLNDLTRARKPLYAHPNYTAGWWIHEREWRHLLAHSGSAKIHRLDKADWMGGLPAEQLIDAPVRPTLCARVLPGPEDSTRMTELDRGFVVPDAWPELNLRRPARSRTQSK